MLLLRSRRGVEVAGRYHPGRNQLVTWGSPCSPGPHPARASSGRRRLPSRTGKAMPNHLPRSLALPRLQVNQGNCRFRRYKNPRRLDPPPRASRVSHHPCSPTLTRPRPPPSARPIDSGCAGSFLASGQRGRCRFWVATHRMVD